MVRRFSSICVWILCSLESAPSLLHSSSWRFSVSVTREVGSHSFQQTDTHIMLGPPLPPSSSHLPRSFSSAVLNEYPPPPPSPFLPSSSSFFIHSPSLRPQHPPRMSGGHHVIFRGSVCRLLLYMLKLPHPSPPPCYTYALTYCFVFMRGSGVSTIDSLFVRSKTD